MKFNVWNLQIHFLFIFFSFKKGIFSVCSYLNRENSQSWICSPYGHILKKLLCDVNKDKKIIWRIKRVFLKGKKLFSFPPIYLQNQRQFRTDISTVKMWRKIQIIFCEKAYFTCEKWKNKGMNTSFYQIWTLDCDLWLPDQVLDFSRVYFLWEFSSDVNFHWICRRTGADGHLQLEMLDSVNGDPNYTILYIKGAEEMTWTWTLPSLI